MEEKKVKEQKKNALKESNYQEKLALQLQRLIEEKTGLKVTTKTALRIALLTAIARLRKESKKQEKKERKQEQPLLLVNGFSYCGNCRDFKMHDLDGVKNLKECKECGRIANMNESY